MNSSDLTFFTNDSGQTLLDRFKSTLNDTVLFDILVGYFRSSGFYQLYESIESVDKTRILVGLGIDANAYQTIQTYQNKSVLDFDSHYKIKRQFQNDLINEVENSTGQDEKLAVIQKEFELLYDPARPVRNHLETLDSVSIVRTIQEALKR